MMAKKIHIKDLALNNSQHSITGEIVSFNNDSYYKISHFDAMPPFFMNIVSNSDLWMFISSNGALTAGRRNPDHALFPYYTDDQIHDSLDITGSKTVIIVEQENKSLLWEPFSDKYEGLYRLERNIYKNILGNHIIYEEINSDLNLTFKYTWYNCDHFGFVKKAHITNNGSTTQSIKLLDGIQNIMPAEVDRRLQVEFSTLVDGYKKNELQAETGLAAFMLSSILTDKAEPSEALRANTVWSRGLESTAILLSTAQLAKFRNGQSVTQETDIRAARGAYFIHAEFQLAGKQDKNWYIVADVHKDHAQFDALSRFLGSDKNIVHKIEEEIHRDHQGLRKKIAQADGFQLSSSSLNAFRHCSNTLFNIMRGGIFDNGYLIDKKDFIKFLYSANNKKAGQYVTYLKDLSDYFKLSELLAVQSDAGPDFAKLCAEYLPISFGRRHGDPSRPWNHFSIDIKDEFGEKKLDYQGNWRDIFQNWEALALSYPEYIESMITKFVNASTADGYNPYRVTRDGFDWEVIDPLEPWSNIGYWGDHQIIYLLKLLELSSKYHPGKLHTLLQKEIFTYANVPYKIKSYQSMLRDPHNTIDFDMELHTAIENKVAEIGADGRLLCDENGSIFYVNLMEKILVPLLVKLSNFVPEAGIWMNTQRPEWNDANNALVGYGTSMVTLYYLRRYVNYCIELFADADFSAVNISQEVFDLFEKIEHGFGTFSHVLSGTFTDQQRKEFLDIVCQAGSDHRTQIYRNGLNGKPKSLQLERLIAFLRLGIQFIDQSIKANKREDNLYHTYNLIGLSSKDEIKVRHLYEMLEGQVAILSAGYLSLAESLTVLNALRRSSLYREDQSSYILYPNRILPRFDEKNTIPDATIEKLKSQVLKALSQQHNILIRDGSGKWHFNSMFHNARLLNEALTGLNDPVIGEKDIHLLLDIYESTFDHQSFTGRSGTFFKYEGLGSIYWHMVSKLLLAVQDTFFHVYDSENKASGLPELKTKYYEIRDGLGIQKSPELHGAFPTDAYSHTPENTGAQQPGMTGQVKEDYISRYGELGVVIHNGEIHFNPVLLHKEEFLSKSQVFTYFDVNNKEQTMILEQDMLAFTICQVPVIYILARENKVFISTKDGSEQELDDFAIDHSLSTSIFLRENKVLKIRVTLNRNNY